jgi:hypothetical protein
MMDLLYHINNINIKERIIMSEELMKEICKAYHYGYAVEKIAEIEEVTVNDVKKAIDWGYENKYFKELKERKD